MTVATDAPLDPKIRIAAIIRPRAPDQKRSVDAP